MYKGYNCLSCQTWYKSFNIHTHTHTHTQSTHTVTKWVMQAHSFRSQTCSTTTALSPWCNGDHHRKWTQQSEFKSWIKLFVCNSHTTNIFGKSMNLTILLPTNSWADWALKSCHGNQSKRRKNLNSNLLNST